MHKGKRLLKQFIILVLILVLLDSCGSPTSQATVTPAQPTASPTSNETITTNIAIDGNEEDWAGYKVIGSDPTGDQVAGSPDLAELKAFNNDRYFYLLIRLHENGRTDHYDILLDTDGGQFDFQVSVWPDKNQAKFAAFPVTAGMTPLDGVTSAQGQVIEVKIPLSAINNKPVRAILVQTFLGSAVGDKINNLVPQMVSEIEPSSVTVVSEPTSQPTQSPEAVGPISGIVYLDTNYTARTVYLSETPPWVVRAGPNDEVLIHKTHTDTIYQVGDGGKLDVYAAFPNFEIEEFGFDRLGNLWFSTNANKLYEVKNGSPVLIAQNVNHRFAFDSLGNVYAVDFPSHGIQKITPDGNVTVLASDVVTSWIDVGPNNEIVVMSNGRLIQVQPDGQWRVVADGLGLEASSLFAPDGKVYILDTRWGINIIDLKTGTKQHLSWYDKFSNTGISGAFDHSGRMLTWHPNMPVIRLDFNAKTAEVVYRQRGNTAAMALGPDGNLYVAYGNLLANGETTLYRIVDKTTLEEIFRVPYGFALSIAFAPDGTGFLGVGDREKDGRIYQFDLDTGDFKDLLKPQCWPNSLAVNPLTGNLWWFSCNYIHERDNAGKIRNYPIPQGTSDKSLAFAPDGTLYAVFHFGYSTAEKVAKYGIYRREADDSWTELTDLTHSDPGIVMAMITVCSDGNLYAVQHLYGNEVGIDYRGIGNTVFLINRTTGDRTPLAWGISPDASVVVCSQENHLFFTTIDGIVEFYKK